MQDSCDACGRLRGILLSFSFVLALKDAEAPLPPAESSLTGVGQGGNGQSPAAAAGTHYLRPTRSTHWHRLVCYAQQRTRGRLPAVQEGEQCICIGTRSQSGAIFGASCRQALLLDGL